ncbi:MAG: thioredoxin family protein [Dehalococcoidia bacterium]|mgnify:FL=1|nr:thioredoxin family protein [Dehalococcoidia bacterium]MDW8009050.1 thioredoxin family protein [Chloroflexota bacterium]
MIPLRDQELLRQRFQAELVDQVRIDFFTQKDLPIYLPGKEPCRYCRPTQEMLQELAGLSDLISLRIHVFEDEPEAVRAFGIERVPAIVLRGRDGPQLKFYGLPSGHEFPEFVETIVHLSRREVPLPEAVARKAKRLQERVTVQVFVTPTCPYCPQMVRAAYALAMANPKAVAAEAIEVSEFPDLARRYNIRAVPYTIINDRVAIPGAVPPEALLEQLAKATGTALVETAPAGETTPAELPSGDEPPPERRSSGGLIIP